MKRKRVIFVYIIVVSTFFLACGDAYCQRRGRGRPSPPRRRPSFPTRQQSYPVGRIGSAADIAADMQKDEVLQVLWVHGSFVPKNEPGVFKDLNTRLGREKCLTRDRKPTIVFYTAEKALKGSRSTREAEASQKVYKRLFDVSREETCILTHFVTMVKIDISDIAPEKDPVINNKAAPLMAFYKHDGTYVRCLPSKSINEREFRWIATNLLAETGIEVNKSVRHFKECLDKIKSLVKKLHRIDNKCNSKREKLAEQKDKKNRSAIKLKEEIEKLQENSDAFSKEINVLKAEAREPILEIRWANIPVGTRENTKNLYVKAERTLTTMWEKKWMKDKEEISKTTESPETSKQAKLDKIEESGEKLDTDNKKPEEAKSDVSSEKIIAGTLEGTATQKAPQKIDKEFEEGEGKKKYEEGLKHYVKSMPGMPNAQAELEKAKEKFEESREHLEKVAQVEPNNGEIQSLVQEIQRLLYNCHKMLIVKK